MNEHLLMLEIYLALALLFVIVLIGYALKTKKQEKIVIEYDTERARKAVVDTTFALLNSALEADCCCNKSYRAFKAALQDGQYLFDHRIRRKLEQYQCVFYEQLILYPLRDELIAVKINVKAKDYIGLHREQPIVTYYDYKLPVVAYAKKELEELTNLLNSR